MCGKSTSPPQNGTSHHINLRSQNWFWIFEFFLCHWNFAILGFCNETKILAKIQIGNQILPSFPVDFTRQIISLHIDTLLLRRFWIQRSKLEDWGYWVNMAKNIDCRVSKDVNNLENFNINSFFIDFLRATHWILKLWSSFKTFGLNRDSSNVLQLISKSKFL